MKRKRLSETNQLAVAAYEAAAERIGNVCNIYACGAILDAAGSSYLDPFREWFYPGKVQGLIGWWPDQAVLGFEINKLPERTMRILALLLMAELVRDGQIDFDAL